MIELRNTNLSYLISEVVVALVMRPVGVIERELVVLGSIPAQVCRGLFRRGGP